VEEVFQLWPGHYDKKDFSATVMLCLFYAGGKCSMPSPSAPPLKALNRWGLASLPQEAAPGSPSLDSPISQGHLAQALFCNKILYLLY